jgi:REP element-mobilizing transposase RayT
MPTKPRKRSATDFYHVMQRGVGLLDVFEDDFDRNRYLEELQKALDAALVEMYAWCLMSNHTHLLVKADYGLLVDFMRQLGLRYARYFNDRHQRTGHLFQGRFTSVPVESEPQLLATVRYIHRNPIRHEERTLCGDYRWSSYGEYLDDSPAFVSTEMVLELLGGVEAFRRFHAVEGDERFLDIDTHQRMGDDEARDIAQQALAAYGMETALGRLGSLPRAERNRALATALACGLGIRQVQRLTGVSYGIVHSVAQSLSGSTPDDRLPQG